MPVTFSAPHPYNQTTIILRNPEWNDSVNVKDEVAVKRSINGTMYTYVKRQKTRRRLTMQFTLDSWKLLEAEEFFRTYYAARMKIIDHLGNFWVGYAVNNPFEWTLDSKAKKTSVQFTGIRGGQELGSFAIELEVVPLGQEQDL